MANVLKQVSHGCIPGLGDQGVDPSEFVDKPRHKDEVIDHGSGIVQQFLGGDEYWYKDGKRHRDGDLPAIIDADGYKAWYRDGLRHRDCDKPAVINIDGSLFWYCNGLRHRDGDKPAVIYPDGRKEWYYDGVQYK